MAKYIVLKPCILSGTEYRIDDVVTEKEVLPKSEAALIRRRFVARLPESESNPASVQKIDVLLNAGNGKSAAIPVTAGTLQSYIDILCSTSENAIGSVRECEDKNLLLMLCYTAPWKVVKSAAEKRLEAITDSKPVAVLQEGEA